MDSRDPRLSQISQPPSHDGVVRLPMLPSVLASSSFGGGGYCGDSRAYPAPAYSSAPVEGNCPPPHANVAVSVQALAPTANVAVSVPASATPSTTGKRKAEAKSSKGRKGKKKKASPTEASPSKRFVWTNAMIAELLELRFKDTDVRRRVEKADINKKKALAWQYFANRLSEKLGEVLSSDQVSNKYKKLKCEYRQGKDSRTDTGNNGREDDSEIWAILNSAFGGWSGIGGITLADADNESDSDDEEQSFASQDRLQKNTTPIESLAATMKEGMTSIAASMGSDVKLVEVLQDLKQSQDAARDLQARQLTLLEHLVSKFTS